VLAGIPFATAIFEYLDLEVKWNFEEGVQLVIDPETSPKILVATVTGKCRNILLAERTALNTLSRASGVATASNRAATIKKDNSWHGYIAGTRKTTPGFRIVEKYSMIVGGVATHRLDLSQMVMLKDNHIWSAGNITEAVRLARSAAGFSMKIEVECQSVEEAIEASAAGADIVMLDNFTAETIHSAAAAVKAVHPSVMIEASGGITEANMAHYMGPHVDILSTSSFTQGHLFP